MQMYNEDSELLFSTGDEDLRRVYLNQNDDSSLAYEIFENNESFIDNKTVVGIPTFEGKKAKVEITPGEVVQHPFLGRWFTNARYLLYSFLIHYIIILSTYRRHTC